MQQTMTRLIDRVRLRNSFPFWLILPTIIVLLVVLLLMKDLKKLRCNKLKNMLVLFLILSLVI